MTQLRTFIATAALLASAGAQAVVVLASPASVYGSNFDNLSTPTWANDSTLPGWELYRNPSANNFAAATAVTGIALGTGSSTAGNVYSFGSTGSGDRALGSLGSGNTTSGGNFWYLLGLSNGSAQSFDSFTLRFDGEQWRNGGNTSAQSLTLEYGFGATAGSVASWTATPFTFTSPIATSSGGALDGNAAANRVAGLGGTVNLSWQAGQTLWLRWFDANDTGSDHGLAIDNLSLSVTAVPEPGSYALMLAGLGAIGFLARRRRA